MLMPGPEGGHAGRTVRRRASYAVPLHDRAASRRWQRAGKAVLLISHDLTSIYRLSHAVVALNQGRVIAEGSVDEIRGNPAVVEAYLGG